MSISSSDWPDISKSASHADIASVIRACSSQAGEDIAVYFDELLFCYLIGNSDMHLKNSDDFKSRLGKLVAENLKVLEGE